MLGRARYVRQLWKALGPNWLAFRLGYWLRLRSGYLRHRTPVKAWTELPLQRFLEDPALAQPDAYLEYRLSAAPTFFFAPEDRLRYQPYFSQWDIVGQDPLSTADSLAQGQLTYFDSSEARVGFPPEWHTNPFTGQQAPSDLHWSQIGDFGYGDIKVIWEPSRFGYVFALVRAYWRTGNDRYAGLFWSLVDDWRRHNRPNEGPNWKCGQETSFRLMAWCFGLYGFLTSPQTTAERMTMLAQMIAVSALRIEQNLSYAISQRNNHGISEGLGLWTAGALFPELDRASMWRETGRQVLESQGRELIYSDGSFSQHSVNYHRLMLHDYLWSLRLGDLHNSPFSDTLGTLVGAAEEWLYQIQEETTGRAPVYGANDGSLILPLNSCKYGDFRPTVQAAHYLRTGTRTFGHGPWDEDLLWMFGPEALTVPQAARKPNSFAAGDGGYYTLRTPHSHVFTRCATFQDRPGHADALHVDIWWRGTNIALDAGTFSYNAEAPWNSPLGRTVYHNTVTVDGLDQMERASRFLWLPWLQGQSCLAPPSKNGHLSYWEGSHSGYQRLDRPVTHRRGILQLGKDWWFVADSLLSSGEHRYRLHWLLADLPYEWTEDKGHLLLQTPSGPYGVRMVTLSSNYQLSLVRAESAGARGWQAPNYGCRQPALSVDLKVPAASTLIGTVFGPGSGQLEMSKTGIELVTSRWRAKVQWHEGERTPLIRSAILEGKCQDELVMESCAQF